MRKNTINHLEKKQKLVKWPKVIAQQLKTIENSNIFDIKSVIKEQPKTLFKAIRQNKKVSQVSGTEKSWINAIYSQTKRYKISWWNDSWQIWF